MFRKRNNSFKPPEAFYDSFKEEFPHANIAIPPANSSATTISPTSLRRTSFTYGLASDLSDGFPEDFLKDYPEDLHNAQCDLQRGTFRNHTDVDDLNRTPRASDEPWISTPPIFHLNAFGSTSPAELSQGYYKPMARWAGTFCETEMGYSDVPELGSWLETGQKILQHSPGSGGQKHFGSMEKTTIFGHQHQPLAQSDYLQRQPAFKPAAVPEDWTGEEETQTAAQTQHASSITDFLMEKDEAITYATREASSDKFRFHVKLYAPTAIVKDVRENSVSYLNKGQVYLMSIRDTAPTMLESTPTRYRTSIRISFKGESQGQEPNTYWQLWKDGRGAKEAEKYDRQLQGVEYVEVQQGTNYDGKVELDASEVDGFSILWSQGSDGSAECHVAMRCNFLSTDFSYAKGVQGILSRLCAKTIILYPPQIVQEVPQVSLCEVKLFRDHGAERKHINDMAYVNRTIGKVKESIAKMEPEPDSIRKKRRRSSASMNMPRHIRPDDQVSHKRNWSVSFKSSAEEGLQSKLITFQNMLLSTRPISILNIPGREMDDPDRQSIIFTSESLDPTDAESEETVELPQMSSVSSTISSSCATSVSDSGIGFQPITPASTTEIRSSNPQHLASPPTEQMNVEMPKQSVSRVLNALVKTLQVASTSRCTSPPKLKPSELSIQNHLNVRSVTKQAHGFSRTPHLLLLALVVACFYTLHSASFSNTMEGIQSQTHYQYQAIYLYQRTVQGLATSIAAKYNYFRPAGNVIRIIHLNKKMKVGIEITVDDDFVREMKEGQDMLLKWAVISDDAQDEEKFELRLIF